jgi:iron complex outermembrane recepter protein
MKKSVMSIAALTLGAALGPNVNAAESDMMLEEIVVTAQRREETVQKSSLAIEVLSAEDMKGITQPTDLNNVAPGVQIGLAGNITQTFIRGVGSFTANGRTESAVAYALDGVYLATGTALIPTMYDISRVEVLKGPQGTLYGRNATGGAINFITNRPTLAEFSGYVGGDVGNFDLRRLNGAVNLPAGDSVAIRAAFQVTERDGYFTDGTGDDDTMSARIRTLWEPNDDFSVLLNVEGAKIDTIGAGAGVVPVLGDDPWRGPQDPLVAPLLATSRTTPPHFDNDQWSVSAEMNANVGIGTLTVIPAYRHEKYDSLILSPGFSFAEKQTAKQKTFEARLGNQTDAVKWVAGAYYYDMDQSFQFDIFNDRFPPAGQDSFVDFPQQSTTSWAVFSEATISIIDPLRLIAGVRYTEDESEGSATSNTRSSLINPAITPVFDPRFPPVGQFPSDFFIDVKIDSDAVSWKGGLEFDVTDDSMAFLTASRGFKGAGFFQDPTGQIDPDNVTFDPEQLTAFELGIRNRFFNNSLQVNLETFYWEYEDQQVAYVGFNTLGFPGFLTVNAGGATIYGADIDIVWRMTAADTLHIGAEYLHARYDDFVRRTIDNGAPSLCTKTPVPSPVPIPVADIDCSDVVMQRSPELSGSVNYAHVFDLPNGASLTFGADAMYQDEKYLTIDFSPLVLVDETLVANADLTYRAPDDRWSITAWVANLSDEELYTGGGVSPINPTVAFFTLNAPRTYGARFNVSF